MSRADVSIPWYCSNQQQFSQSNRIVRASAGVWYAFIQDGATANFWYAKSVNYGLTWGVVTSIKATAVRNVSVWFDKWTPGDTGTLIHLAYFDTTNSDVFYRSLDTASDTLGTERVVFLGASALSSEDTCISITKSKAGRILVGFDIDSGTETGFYKSDDYPVTAFSSKTDLNESTSDYYMLFPGNDADTADIYAIYWDRSADALSLKVYDDSADSWSETAIAGSMVDVGTASLSPQFAGAVRNSDGHLIVAAWTAADLANADLRLWDINGAASITEMTNVVLNSSDDQAMVAVGIDTTADEIYVFYAGKSDGTETAFSAVNVYYKTSSDGGATWGAETKLTSVPRAISNLNCSLESDSGEFVVAYEWVMSSGGDKALMCSAFYESGAGGGGPLIGGRLISC